MDKSKQHIMYGFVSGMGLVIVSLIIYVTGMAFKPGMSYISYIPFLIGIILNAIAYSKSKDGFVTFGNVFGNCFKACLIVTIIVVAWAVASTSLFPEMKEKAFEIARESMAKNPKMTDEAMDSGMSIMKKFYIPMMIAGSLLSTLFYGAIFSLIGAMVAKKKGAPPITSDHF
ncbi:MAG: hypothetical protein JWQ38_61 [Flavipsychrobacter sp.]|nr:hypothetical protein [Flavipsychrobacter sp.]